MALPGGEAVSWTPTYQLNDHVVLCCRAFERALHSLLRISMGNLVGEVIKF